MAQAWNVQFEVMEKSEVHEGGVLAAVFFSLFATCGYFLTTGRTSESYDWLWIALFALSLFMLSGAVVNFDLKRIIK
jgi:hypothetical protein